jgi:two-component system chemotaxis response regulator CheY
MAKRVLSVGQCGFDHGGITRFLQGHFDVSVTSADNEREALDELTSNTYDLVLVNRKFDADGSDGVAFIRRLKSSQGGAADKAADQRADVPVMLVSNQDDAQQRAIEAGALPGFGKSELNAPATAERLRDVLG